MSTSRKSRNLGFALVVALITVVLMLAGSFTASAEEEEYFDGEFTYTIVRNEVMITGFYGTDTDVVIPIFIDDYPVTMIGEGAFQNCEISGVRGLSVEYIAPNAFSYSSVSELYLPSLEYISNGAFTGCYDLKEMYIPEVYWIGTEAFELDGSDFTIIAPFGSYAYDYAAAFDIRVEVRYNYKCDGFYFDIVNYNEAIITGYFGDSMYIEIPERINNYPVVAIADYAFYDVDKPIYVSMTHVKTVHRYAFYGCDSLELGDCSNVETVGEYAFAQSKIEDLDMPNVKTINRGAFSYCTYMNSAKLPAVQEIWDMAFEGCWSLRNIFLRDVTNIGLLTFDSNGMVRFFAPEGSYAYNFAIEFNHEVCPADYYEDGIAYTISSGEATVTYYDPMYFSGIIPEYVDGYPVTTLGAHALEWSATYEIDTACIKYIEAGAFASGYLTRIYMPNVEYIDPFAFEYTSYLTDIIVGEGNQYYSSIDGVLYNKDKTELVAYPSGRKDENFVVPKGVTTICDYAFQWHEHLTSIAMPDVTTIGYFSFFGCEYLESVKMHNAVCVDETAFWACDNLTIYGYRDSYAQQYATDNYINFVEIEPQPTEPVSYEIVDGKIVFTVITPSGDYNRLKLTTADNLGGSLVTANNYTVNENGDYVWTIKFTAPKETTTYAFDLRSSVTGKYVKEYITYEIEIIPIFKSVSHEIVDGKVIFTVVTSAGDYNRLKLTKTDNLSGSLVTANNYTVNENGEYVWTIRFTEPTETTQYAFDLRSSETGKYVKDYFVYEAEIVPTFKSISHKIVDGKLVITVVTAAGDYNRIKLTTADDLRGSLATVSSYTVNEDGDYVWVIKITAPEETINYAFDLRSSETGKYVKDYGYYECTIEKTIKTVACEDAGDNLIFTVITKAGDYNRIRCGLSESIADNIINANSYTVNEDGDYVWVVKLNKPTESTELYFDLRSSETGKFIKEFYIFKYVA